MKINSSIYLLTAGFFSILGQVVILRELNAAFYGIELIYILSFALWMIGAAIGAAAGNRKYIPGDKSINILFILSAVLLMGDIIFIRGIRILFGGVPGGYLPFIIQISGLLIALLPAGFFSGLLFQWTAKKYISKKGTLAKAYAVESAGGILGGLISTLFLNQGISNFSIALTYSGCIAFIFIAFSIYRKNRLIKYLTAASAVFIFILFGFSHHIDMMLTSWNHHDLVESVDTPYGRITITSSGKQICVFEDDVLSYETQSVSAEEFVHLAALQTVNPDNILVLGGGYAGIISELLKLPVRKIDYVEINKNLVDLLKIHLPGGLRKSLTDEKVEIINNDPRKFLQKKRSYDIIFTGMPEPMSAQNNRFYTKEFFRQCSGSLKAGGILAFKIASSENIWTPQLTERNAAVYNAVKSEFNYVLVLPGVENIFIASESELITGTKTLIDRFNARNLKTRLVSPQYINYVFTNDRFNEIKALLSDNNYIINSDMHPVCFTYTTSIWLSKFFPDFTYRDDFLQKTGSKKILIILCIILFAAVFIFTKKSVWIKRSVLVFAAGFMGMILETILILFYQTKEGILYSNIGMLLTAFMAGLALGSYIINKSSLLTKKIFTGRLLFAGFAFLNLAAYLLMNYDLMNGFIMIFIMLLFDGMFVAGIFAFISLYNIEAQQDIVKQLYAADLLGGCAGSIIASLVLIPVYGFFFSIMTMIIICAGCFIILL